VKINSRIISGGGAIERQLGDIMRNKLEATGRDMVTNANSAMEGSFDLNRPYERRRNPGSRRAATALDYEVEETGTGYEVNFRVVGGDDVLMRILIMNYGSDSHDIFPTGGWELGGLNPKTVSRTASGFNKIAGDTGGGKLAYPSSRGGYWVGGEDEGVTHPGTSGRHFLEDGRDAAAAVHL
jgi:hypothetical protein